MKIRFSHFRFSVLPLVAAALLFASCDKIEPSDNGTYTLFAGISANWSDGEPFAAEQRVLVEKFTGPKCPNCPAADITLDAAHNLLGDKVVIISINHPVGQGVPFNGDPDMRTEDGNTWDNYYGVNAIPAAFINRDKSKQYTGSMSNITADLQTAVDASPAVGLSVTADSTSDGSALNITVGMQFLQRCSQELTLTLALVEDSLVYRQSNGDEVISDYKHNHMLRDVLTDIWGAKVDATGAEGECRKATFSTYRIKDSSIRLQNSHIVAFVSERNSKKVLNSASCHIH